MQDLGVMVQRSVRFSYRTTTDVDVRKVRCERTLSEFVRFITGHCIRWLFLAELL
ncbi:hypothetical protein AArcMg_0234 [Natrarchaeobaculum sulfurireducens]|uniref:Uncharacterized protein n=1 Tax=Natrarchaeobaculum sulfurireducens TaxID=2044521 RepID=A0A346PL62_9EURY|nr:hypothetical protein AArcMg_0234 [Natrarchaeobaculum sulfurireducens]